MKTNLWKRVAALLTTVALAAGMVVVSAGAVNLSYEEACSNINKLMYDDYAISAQEAYDRYTSLIQQYPSEPAAFSARAELMYYSHQEDGKWVLGSPSYRDPAVLNLILNDYQTAISLAEAKIAAQPNYYDAYSYYSEVSCDHSMMADIYAEDLGDQASYIAHMESSYAALRREAIASWNDPELYANEEAQLKEIKRWYSSSEKSFTTRDNHVSVTVAVGDTTIPFSFSDVSGYYWDPETDTDIPYTASYGTLNFSKPVQKVVRTLGHLILFVPKDTVFSRTEYMTLNNGQVVSYPVEQCLLSEESDSMNPPVHCVVSADFSYDRNYRFEYYDICLVGI